VTLRSGDPHPTPQAHSTQKRALTLGAELIERELEVLRGRAVHGTPQGSTEGAVMHAMDLGICAGRLRTLAEAEPDDRR
jgi:hypothetical protein